MVHIVLVGGGHAHAQVLKGLNQWERPEDVRVTLIDKQDKAFYSGMMPGCVARLYELKDTQIDLRAVTTWAGIDFIQSKVMSIDATTKQVHCEDGTTVTFDLLSVDIGSQTLGTDAVPGVRDYAITTRPINELPGKLAAVEDKFRDAMAAATAEEPFRIAIVGGGVAGVELALCVHHRFARVCPHLQVTIIQKGSSLVPELGSAVRAALEAELAKHGIQWVGTSGASHVTEGKVHCGGDGPSFPFNCLLWAAGAQPHALKMTGIETTAEGFMVVNEYLQSVSCPHVFGGGDCIFIRHKPAPKAGVYAVRAGPILLNNLTALAKGDGSAIGTKWGFTMQGPWVWALKDYIDRTFMKIFDPELLPCKEDMCAGSTRRQYDACLAQDNSVDTMLADEAAGYLRDHTSSDFHVQHAVLKRMATDEAFMNEVVALLVPDGPHK